MKNSKHDPNVHRFTLSHSSMLTNWSWLAEPRTPMNTIIYPGSILPVWSERRAIETGVDTMNTPIDIHMHITIHVLFMNVGLKEKKNFFCSVSETICLK